MSHTQDWIRANAYEAIDGSYFFHSLGIEGTERLWCAAAKDERENRKLRKAARLARHELSRFLAACDGLEIEQSHMGMEEAVKAIDLALLEDSK